MAEKPSPTPPLVLVIDDDPLVRATVVLTMKEMGCDAIEAYDGEMGIRLFDQQTPDLVITDILMPVKEGVETIVDIRKRNPRVGIIAVSGGGRTRNMAFLNIARRLGADRVLSKPFEPDDLIAAARDLLPC